MTSKPDLRVSKDVITRRYKKPPVHEVMLDLQFHSGVGEPELRDVRKRLADRFQRIDEQSAVELMLSVGPQGQDVQAGQQRTFAGWLFRTEPPGWVLRTAPAGLTLHTLRPGKWPGGEYVGWSVIFDRFKEVYGALTVTYGELKTKRIGLRYLNRIAMPRGVELDDWILIPLQVPGPLESLYTFKVESTWANAGGHSDISARVALQKISVEDPKLAESHDGVLLDIDIFNLWIPSAPPWAGVLDWYERAHAIENRVFESTISDRLRSHFDNDADG